MSLYDDDRTDIELSGGGSPFREFWLRRKLRRQRRKAARTEAALEVEQETRHRRFKPHMPKLPRRRKEVVEREVIERPPRKPFLSDLPEPDRTNTMIGLVIGAAILLGWLGFNVLNFGDDRHSISPEDSKVQMPADELQSTEVDIELMVCNDITAEASDTQSERDALAATIQRELGELATDVTVQHLGGDDVVLTFHWADFEPHGEAAWQDKVQEQVEPTVDVFKQTSGLFCEGR